MKYVRYTTQQRDRWDTLAMRFYGDPYGYWPIIRANPTVPITPELPPKRVIAIPVLERSTAQLLGLPPWRASQSG